MHTLYLLTSSPVSVPGPVRFPVIVSLDSLCECIRVHGVCIGYFIKILVRPQQFGTVLVLVRCNLVRCRSATIWCGADAVQLQRDLLSLTGWSSEHFMNFNANECKYLVMTKKKSFMHTSYNLSGSQVEVVSIEKDLGVHVSSSLSWNNHIDLVISKANKMLCFIYRTCTTD